MGFIPNIQQSLQPLIGLPLTDMWRYAGFQKFEFGPQRPFINRRGERATHGSVGLVVSCRWRISDGHNLQISDADFKSGCPATERVSIFIQQLLSSSPHVLGFTANENQSLNIRLSHDFSLEVVTDEIESREHELYRLVFRDRRKAQVVFTPGGIERQRKRRLLR